jgi:hypothetical protein
MRSPQLITQARLQARCQTIRSKQSSATSSRSLSHASRTRHVTDTEIVADTPAGAALPALRQRAGAACESCAFLSEREPERTLASLRFGRSSTVTVERPDDTPAFSGEGSTGESGACSAPAKTRCRLGREAIVIGAAGRRHHETRACRPTRQRRHRRAARSQCLAKPRSIDGSFWLLLGDSSSQIDRPRGGPEPGRA